MCDSSVDQSEQPSGGIECGSILTDGVTRYVLEDIEDNQLVVGRLGDRLLDECPVKEGGECIDQQCGGRIGEIERDPETMSAHELFCYGCGLNWVEHGGSWEETRAEWPTSFSYDEGDD